MRRPLSCRLAPAAALLMLALHPCGCTPIDPGIPYGQELTARAEAHLLAGEPEAALRLLMRAASFAPNDVAMRLRIAHLAEDVFRPADGLVALQEAREIDPSLHDDASLNDLSERLIALHEAQRAMIVDAAPPARPARTVNPRHVPSTNQHTIVRADSDTSQMTNASAITTFSVAELHRLAAQGNGAALNILGVRHMTGEGVPRDLRRAIAYFERAAEAGEFSAMNNVAAALMDLGPGPEDMRARAVLEDAVRRRVPPAYRNLAIMLRTGRGGKADPERAIGLFEQAVRVGDSDAALHLGQMHSLGIGTEHDEEGAFYWFHLAAHMGEPSGMHTTGLRLLHGAGTKSDISAAVSWLERAAERGYAPSALELGTLYASGDLIEPDPVVAAHWFRRGAELGCSESQMQAGRAAGGGWAGEPDMAVEANEDEARRWRDALRAAKPAEELAAETP